MQNRPAPWSPLPARLSGAAIEAAVAISWVILIIALAATHGDPRVCAYYGGASAVISVAAVAQRGYAARAPWVAPFADDDDWERAYQVCRDLDRLVGGGIERDTWRSLSDASAHHSDTGSQDLYLDLLSSARRLVNEAGRRPDRAVNIRRTRELLDGIAQDMTERNRAS